MDDLNKIIELRARTDGMYAIAYAILVGKRLNKKPDDVDRRLLEKLSAYLTPRQDRPICCLQVWIECFGRQRSEYDLTSARLLARAIMEIPGWCRESPRHFPKYGAQKVFKYYPSLDDVDAI